MRPSKSAIGPCYLVFYTVHGGVDQGESESRPRGVGVEDK